jgi:hypothetical protein
MLFSTGILISRVLIIVWLLDMALDTVSRVITAGFVIIFDGDVAMKKQGSGHKQRG